MMIEIDGSHLGLHIELILLSKGDKVMSVVFICCIFVFFTTYNVEKHEKI